MRKIIQVSTCGVENTMGTQCNYVVIALCDDGTVWLNRNVDSHWDELSAIPQPEKKESKHTCQFSRSIIDGETETCSCGAWRY